MNRKLFFIFVFVFLTACAVPPAEIPTGTSQLPPHTQTVTAIGTTAIEPTSSPTLKITSTQILPSATPDFCNPVHWNDGKILVLSNDLFDALRPGGPNEFDRILISQNTEWENFQQEIEEMDGELWTAGQIFASFAWGYELGTGVNPAVILVTYGVKYDWELPEDGDLVSKVDQIRGQLHSFWGEIARNEIDLSQYPQIANAATYTLYRYFYEESRILEDWCQSYVIVFGEPPFNNTEH